MLRGVDSCPTIIRLPHWAKGERRPETREQQALDQQLARDPEARGAEREAQRQLVTAARGARQHQVGDVGAGNQQDDRDHRHDDPERLLVARAKPGRSCGCRNKGQTLVQVLVEHRLRPSFGERGFPNLRLNRAQRQGGLFDGLPGFSLAMIDSTQVERASSQLAGPCTIACVPSGTATSNERPWLGPRNDGGVTPTIVNGARSSVRRVR